MKQKLNTNLLLRCGLTSTLNPKPKCGTPYKTDRSLMMNCEINLPDETLPNKPVSLLRSDRSKQRLQEYVGVRSHPATIRSQSTRRSLAKRLTTSIASTAAWEHQALTSLK